MAGERILVQLQQGLFYGLNSAVEDYLKPVLLTAKGQNGVSEGNNKTHGLFSVRYLHGLVSKLDEASEGEMVSLLPSVCSSYQCARQTEVKMKDRTTLPSLLYHLISKYLKKGHHNGMAKLAQSLYTELENLEPDHITARHQLACSGYAALWNAALNLEEQDRKSHCEATLELRHASLKLLLLSNKAQDFCLEKLDWSVSRVENTFNSKDCCSLPKTIREMVVILFSDIVQTLKGLDKKNTRENCMFQALVQLRCMHFLNRNRCAEDMHSCQSWLNSYLATVEDLANFKADSCYSIFRTCHSLVQLIIFFHKLTEEKSNPGKQDLSKTNELLQACHKTVCSISDKPAIQVPVFTALLECCSPFVAAVDSNNAKSTVNLSRLDKSLFTSVVEFYSKVARLYGALGQLFKQQKYKPDQIEKKTKYGKTQQLKIVSSRLEMILNAVQRNSDLTVSEVREWMGRCLKEAQWLQTLVTDQTVSKKHPYYIGHLIYRLGQLNYTKADHEMAVHFLKIGITLMDGNSPTEGQAWKKYELLAEVLRKQGEHQKALKVIAEGLLLDVKELRLAAEYWVRVKHDAAKTRGVTPEGTLWQVMQGSSKFSGQFDAASVLLAELQAFRSSRSRSLDEQLLLSGLLAEAAQGIQQAYALLLRAQTLWAAGTADTSEAVACCEKAASLLQTQTTTEITQHRVTDLLAMSHLWSYIIADVQPEQVSPVDRKKEQTPSSTPDNSDALGTPEKKQDSLLIGYCNLVTENAHQVGLDSALALWEEMVGSIHFKAEGLECASESVQCVATLAAIYRLSNKVHLELRALRVLLSLGQAAGCTQQCVDAHMYQVRAFCALRQLHAARDCLRALKTAVDPSGKALVCETSPSYIHVLAAEAEVHLLEGQVDLAWNALNAAIEMRQKYFPDKTKEHLILESTLKYLHARLKALPQSYFKMSSSAVTSGGSCIELQMDGVRLLSGVVNFVLGHAIIGSKMPSTKADTGTRAHSTMEKWRLLSDLLTGLLMAGKTSTLLAEAREARCYLKQGLLIAQAFNLPRRTAEFSLALAWVDNLSGQFNETKSQLHLVSYILTSQEQHSRRQITTASSPELPAEKQQEGTMEHKEQTAEVPEKKSKKSQVDDCFGFAEASPGDDDFIKCRPVLLSDDEDRPETPDIDLGASPTVKRSKTKLPDYLKHPVGCPCEGCQDISLHGLVLDYMLLCGQEQRLLAGHKQASRMLNDTVQVYADVSSKADKVLQDFRVSSATAAQQEQPKVKRVSPYHGTLANILLEAAHISLETGDVTTAQRKLSEAKQVLDVDENSWMLESLPRLARLYFLQYQTQVAQGSHVDDICKSVQKISLTDKSGIRLLANSSSSIKNNAQALNRKSYDSVKTPKRNTKRPVIDSENDTRTGAGIISNSMTQMPNAPRRNILCRVAAQGDVGPPEKLDLDDSVECSDEPQPAKPAEDHDKQGGRARNKEKRRVRFGVEDGNVDLMVDLKQDAVKVESRGRGRGRHKVPALNCEGEGKMTAKNKVLRKSRSLRGQQSEVPDSHPQFSDELLVKSMSEVRPGNDVKGISPDFCQLIKTPRSVSSRRAALDMLIESDSDEDMKPSKSNMTKRRTGKHNTQKRGVDPAIENKDKDLPVKSLVMSSKESATCGGKGRGRKAGNRILLGDRNSHDNINHQPDVLLDSSHKSNAKTNDIDDEDTENIYNLEGSDKETKKKRTVDRSKPLKAKRNTTKQKSADIEMVRDDTENISQHGQQPVCPFDDPYHFDPNAFSDEEIVSKSTKSKKGGTKKGGNGRGNKTTNQLGKTKLTRGRTKVVEEGRRDEPADDMTLTLSPEQIVICSQDTESQEIYVSALAQPDCVENYLCPQLYLVNLDDNMEIVSSSGSQLPDLDLSLEKQRTNFPENGDENLSQILVAGNLNDSIEIMRGESGDETCQKARRRGCKSVKSRKKAVMYDDTEVPRLAVPIKDYKTGSPRYHTGTKMSQSRNSISTTTGKESMEALLEKAHALVKHFPPPLLYRGLCQALALHALPSNAKTAAFYLTEAMAVTFRHTSLVNMAKKIRKLEKENGDPALIDQLTQMRSMLQFDKGVDNLQKLIDSIPEGLTVCQVSMLDTQIGAPPRMVLTRMCAGQDPVVLEMPGFSKPKSQKLLVEFNEMMSMCKQTMKLTDKVEWWSQRLGLDDKLKVTLQCMDYEWLAGWQGMLLGTLKNTQDQKGLEAAVTSLRKQWPSLDPRLAQILIGSYHELHASHIPDVVCCVFGVEPGTEEYSGAVAALQRHVKQLNLETASRNPTVLILDKGVQWLPWECMPILEGQEVSRMASMHLLQLHSLALTSSATSPYTTGIDPRNTFYIVNPEDNLPATEEKFKGWFEKEEGWSGIMGRKPTQEEFTHALVKPDLFIYAGHGCGSKFLPGDLIQMLQCRAAVLLVGCSSGRLAEEGSLEPHGMMLSYFLAGCPCMLGNLWDVTDKDIDRLLEQLLNTWLRGEPGTSLLKALPSSRKVCRMPYLIGCAPVLYGLPVSIK